MRRDCEFGLSGFMNCGIKREREDEAGVTELVGH